MTFYRKCFITYSFSVINSVHDGPPRMQVDLEEFKVEVMVELWRETSMVHMGEEGGGKAKVDLVILEKYLLLR